MRVKKLMRLYPRVGEPRERDIGGFQEEEQGYRVRDVDGKDLGYFGPDKYEMITFEARWFEDSSPR
jgi:hypothetical protein